MQSVLDMVEKLGNKVPHPAIIFLSLIAFVILLSALLSFTGTQFTTEVIVLVEAAEKEKKSDTKEVPNVSDYELGPMTRPEPSQAKTYRVEKRIVRHGAEEGIDQ